MMNISQSNQYLRKRAADYLVAGAEIMDYPVTEKDTLVLHSFMNAIDKYGWPDTKKVTGKLMRLMSTIRLTHSSKYMRETAKRLMDIMEPYLEEDLVATDFSIIEEDFAHQKRESGEWELTEGLKGTDKSTGPVK